MLQYLARPEARAEIPPQEYEALCAGARTQGELIRAARKKVEGRKGGA
jgi:hypothetical protein